MARPRSPKGRARQAHLLLAAEYPGDAVALCALDHRNPFELLVATILSAQCTDERVNQVTPHLFAAFPTPAAFAAAPPAAVEELIRPTGFYRNKAKSLLGMAHVLDERFGGEVPTTMGDLVTLPGVGRKTANVVRSVAMGLPGLPVDTHVGRLARRLDLTRETDPVRVEMALNPMVPAAERGVFSLRLILHGRAICRSRTPRCGECALPPSAPRRAGSQGARRGDSLVRPGDAPLHRSWSKPRHPFDASALKMAVADQQI
ncbi:endonuclease III [Iamia sp. SCSIO 61187]|uniref:endonuclease III n=1 Tax=Iamia sp. SCSIO 61187 TaxID=2722752 RepID=UPI001C631290|nr:endonuclease III [Iamia sp. SCSIO 61187]QYG93363.1 endonuclease III [Iamia sp. SCSIO 61187]